MIRTTTPTHSFTLPFDPAEADELWITYAQNKWIQLEKKLPDLTIDSVNNTVSFMMTQQESALFNSNTPVKVQIKVRQGDVVMASDIYKLRVEDVLNANFMGV